MFRLFFGDEKNKANTLALYNALNHSSYSDEEDLEITTIEDVIYIKMKNDISFVIADTMNLYEQQASHNPNMPIEEAVNKAIDDCISEGILVQFLRTHRAEVVDMYLSEVNEDILRERLMEEGSSELLHSLIQKKLSKGKSLEQIADELETDVETIRPMYEKLL